MSNLKWLKWKLRASISLEFFSWKKTKFICLFVYLFICLFVCLWFYVPSRIFYSYEDVSITENFKFWLILGMHSHWAVRHIYFDTGHPYIMVISKDSEVGDTRTWFRAMDSRAVTTCFNSLSETPISCVRGESALPLSHRCSDIKLGLTIDNSDNHLG